MKHLFAKLYNETTLGHLLISPPKRLYDLFRYQLVPEKLYLKRAFRRRLGYELNLKNPTTLNEKIQWLKLNDRTPLHTLCADKCAVRDHIKRTIGEQYLIPIHFTTEDPDDIAPDNLPDTPCVIKANHNSGGAVFVTDKSKIDWPDTRRHFTELLKINHYYRTKEWQYKDIKPRIIVEKLLLDDQSRLPLDYKFHCFNGRVVLAQVDQDRQGDHRRNLYDLQWKLHDFTWHKDNGKKVERPKRLDDLITLAETLARDFRLVRADFYNLDRDIYFGELTFHPAAGFERFHPRSKDLELGSQLDLQQ